MRNRLFILLAATVLAFAACDNKTVYHHYEHVSTGGWDKNDTMKFSIPPIQKAGQYQEEVELRITNDYPFLGLTLLLEQTVMPMGKQERKMERQSLEYTLLTSEGHPIGTGVKHFNYSFRLKDLHLNEGDSLQINIVHNMKREIMPGISDIGIKLSEGRD